jgi:ribosomal protein S18 acetylase RimI-like enzyme
VLELDGAVVGLYRLAGEFPEGFLTDLWLEPEFQGRGFERRLWEHALASAAALGYRSLVLEADPNAEGFYTAMGAICIGERESPRAQNVEPVRVLPLMRIEPELYRLSGRRRVRFSGWRPRAPPGSLEA